MTNIPVNFYDDTCIKIYNPVHKKVIAVYKNYWSAGKGLGVEPDIIFKKCSNKSRLKSSLFNMDVACRLSKLTEEDKKLIELTIKKRNICQTL